MALKALLILALAFGFSPAIQEADSVEASRDMKPAIATPDGDAINKTSLKLPLINPKIVVVKSKRELVLYSKERIVRRYRVGLGFSPVGDKSRQGDGRTPEGTFYVCSKNPKSNYYLSLGLSYPDQEHAERALRERLITRKQYDEIARAIKAKAVPPWNTPLGGEIFIHGNGSRADWTAGCVALDNENMRELYEALPKGTPVTIVP